RNIVQQGGISYYWRPLYQNRISLSACVFLDYYLITLRRSDGIADTLICDLTKRQWYRFSNVPALSYISSSGSAGMEGVWAGIAGSNRLARIGPCFFPDFTVLQVDDNGTAVMPTFETPWYRVSQEGRKRVRFAYLSYDTRVTSGTTHVMDVGYIRSPQDPSYTDLGSIPSTDQYTRWRLPLGQSPYGVAFKVKPIVSTSAVRVFDLALAAWGEERSRV